MGLLEIQVPARAPAAIATLVGPCCTASVGPVRSLGAPAGTRLNNGSRMSREVHVRFCERGGVRFPSATHLIVTSRSKELLETEVKAIIESFLRERGLNLSPEKTKITHITEGFDFLGQHVRRYPNGKLLIKPAEKHPIVVGPGEGDHPGARWQYRPSPHRSSESGDQRLGQLSSSRRLQTHLCPCRCHDLPAAVEVGASPPSA
jgi:hypothetical protein